MAQAKLKPLYDPPTDIEDDFHGWCFEQAELLRQRRFGEADLPNVIEELESMGRRDKAALTSAYRVLIMHLLKWQFQPDMRSASWRSTIRTQRREIEAIEEMSPSLAAKADDLVANAYRKARADAADETGLKADIFPAACPYRLDDLRELRWLPDAA